jgi:uncharacterized protein YecT (DUF1311 family)
MPMSSITAAPERHMRVTPHHAAIWSERSAAGFVRSIGRLHTVLVPLDVVVQVSPLHEEDMIAGRWLATGRYAGGVLVLTTLDLSRLAALLMAAMFVAAPLRAQQPGATGTSTARTVPPADTVAISSQPQLNEREAVRHVVADSALNATWRELRRRLPAARFARLREEQRRWITEREADCAEEAATVRGGQAESMVWSGCMATAAEARTRRLRTVLPAGTTRRDGSKGP